MNKMYIKDDGTIIIQGQDIFDIDYLDQRFLMYVFNKTTGEIKIEK